MERYGTALWCFSTSYIWLGPPWLHHVSRCWRPRCDRLTPWTGAHCDRDLCTHTCPYRTDHQNSCTSSKCDCSDTFELGENREVFRGKYHPDSHNTVTPIAAHAVAQKRIVSASCPPMHHEANSPNMRELSKQQDNLINYPIWFLAPGYDTRVWTG